VSSMTSCDKELEVPEVRGLDFALGEREFRLLTFFTGPRCNLGCPYCFTGTWDKDGTMLSFRELSATFAGAAKLGAEALWWVGQGEPFMEPSWRDIVRSAQDLGLWLGVFTNGTQFDDDASDFIVNHDVSLYMKLNSFDPTIQGELIGSDGALYLDQVLPRIECFVDQGMAKAHRLAVESVITKLNYGEIPMLFRWCRDREIVPFIEMMEHACDGAKELDVTPEQHVKLFCELQRIDREEYGYEWDIVPPWAAYRCQNIYLGLAVDTWGNVTPCSGMRYHLGNIREKSLGDIWESDEARKMRDPARQEPQPWDGEALGCYGCKSHAYHVTGNPYAVDPRCSWFDATAKSLEAAL